MSKCNRGLAGDALGGPLQVLVAAASHCNTTAHQGSGVSLISVGSPKPPVFLVLFFFPPVLSVSVRKAGAHKPGTREARCQLPASGGGPRPAALWWLRADVWQKCSASRRPSEAENLSEDRINSPRLSYSRVCAKSFEYVK